MCAYKNVQPFARAVTRAVKPDFPCADFTPHAILKQDTAQLLVTGRRYLVLYKYTQKLN